MQTWPQDFKKVFHAQLSIFIFISRENFHAQLCLARKNFASVCNLRSSRTHFILSGVEHEKGFITSGPGKQPIH